MSMIINKAGEIIIMIVIIMITIIIIMIIIIIIIILIITIIMIMEQAGEIIQPLVKIRVLGHPSDSDSWQSNPVSITFIIIFMIFMMTMMRSMMRTSIVMITILVQI